MLNTPWGTTDNEKRIAAADWSLGKASIGQMHATQGSWAPLGRKSQWQAGEAPETGVHTLLLNKVRGLSECPADEGRIACHGRHCAQPQTGEYPKCEGC